MPGQQRKPRFGCVEFHHCLAGHLHIEAAHGRHLLYCMELTQHTQHEMKADGSACAKCKLERGRGGESGRARARSQAI